MQAVILAGGRGERLRPLTDHAPKPMIPVAGKPFLQHQLELIGPAGIDKVLLLVGYLGDEIESYFANGSRVGLDMTYSYEKTPLGTGGALKNAENKLENEFLLLNGDTYLPIDYEKLITSFRQSSKTGVVAVYNNADKITPNNITVLEEGVISGYNKTSPAKMTHVDAGAYMFKKSVLDFMPAGKACSLQDDVFPELIKKRELSSFSAKQRFYDMGSFLELEKLKKVLK